MTDVEVCSACLSPFHGPPCPRPSCACGGPCEHDGSLAAERARLRDEATQ